jgi:hypothetical protein
MLRDYLRLAGQQQIAATRQDSATLAKLDPLVCDGQREAPKRSEGHQGSRRGALCEGISDTGRKR